MVKISSDKKINLLFVTHDLSFGGAEKILCWLSESFANSNLYSVYIANLNAADIGISYSRTVSDKVTIYSIKRPKIRKIGKIAQLIGLCGIVKNNNIDAIISFTRIPNLLATLAGTLTKTRTIISERCDPKVFLNTGLINKLIFEVMKKADACVFQTDGAQKMYGNAFANKSRVIPNPVFPMNIFKDNDDEQKTIVSVGRLDNQQKRYDVMLRSFGLFSESHPEYKLKIYGKGPDEALIREWIAEYRLDDLVSLMGFVEEPSKHIVKDQIFIITSDYEGIPNSLLEAMALGMPVVSTDCSPGGARLVIRSGINGILVKCGDIVATANALSEFADCAELRKKCGDKAKEILEEYSPDTIFSMWESYITDILNNRN